MIAISIKSPFAQQIAEGQKKIEYRKWRTAYRGPLLICCSKSPRSDISGMAVAIADLVDILPDRQYGYAWFLDNVRPIKPFSVSGRLHLFEVQFPKDRES